ncbi:MAG: hypothetical protein U9N49_08415 [Campylobacterota bacterium]|nr:hypothetical protein [Campylobacterota bacterium]
MGIHIEALKEGCCEYPTQLNFLDGDAFDANRATCDKVIECDDKYILVEEKSFIFGFFDSCCQEKKKSIGAFIEDGKLSDRLISFIDENYTLEEKRRVFAESVTKLFISSLDKVSNTTHILATEYNSDKSKNMPIIYLYCKSGKSPIDRLATLSLSKYKNEKKQVMVECSKLEKFLEIKGCA